MYAIKHYMRKEHQIGYPVCFHKSFTHVRYDIVTQSEVSSSRVGTG